MPLFLSLSQRHSVLVLLAYTLELPPRSLAQVGQERQDIKEAI